MSEVKVNKISPRSGTDVTLGDSGDTFTIPAGASIVNNGTQTGFGRTGTVNWQSTVKTANFTAVSGEGYFCNTTSGEFTATLPASPSAGDIVAFKDYAQTFDTNNLLIDRNGSPISGVADNKQLNTEGISATLVYVDGTQGWLVVNDGLESSAASLAYNVDFLVIAGGASGGRGSDNSGGGGGAGGYRNSYNSETSGGGGSSESSLTLTQGTTYTITVGAGGAARSSDARGDNGGDSSISGTGITTITSTGGGGGGAQAINGDGIAGGSGGGACYGSSPSAQSGGSGTANQGFRGGNKQAVGSAQGAGGGGAGAQGVDCSSGTNEATDGGNGVASTITGSSVTRAGGGGGSAVSAADSSGGTGGGGNSSLSGTAGSGTINTGSGGGGTKDGTSGAGGSGVVILRMPTASYSGTTTGSPTVSTDGSDTILIFNASGSYTG